MEEIYYDVKTGVFYEVMGVAEDVDRLKHMVMKKADGSLHILNAAEFTNFRFKKLKELGESYRKHRLGVSHG